MFIFRLDILGEERSRIATVPVTRCSRNVETGKFQPSEQNRK